MEQEPPQPRDASFTSFPSHILLSLYTDSETPSLLFFTSKWSWCTLHRDNVDGVSSLNCSYQRAYFSSPTCMSMENHGGMMSTEENSWFVGSPQLSGNPTSSHLVAIRRNERRKLWIWPCEVSLFKLPKKFLHAVKSYDVGPPALLGSLSASVSSCSVQHRPCTRLISCPKISTNCRTDSQFLNCKRPQVGVPSEQHLNKVILDRNEPKLNHSTTFNHLPRRKFNKPWGSLVVLETKACGQTDTTFSRRVQSLGLWAGL
jgi:hypothetical protein